MCTVFALLPDRGEGSSLSHQRLPLQAFMAVNVWEVVKLLCKLVASVLPSPSSLRGGLADPQFSLLPADLNSLKLPATVPTVIKARYQYVR